MTTLDLQIARVLDIWGGSDFRPHSIHAYDQPMFSTSRIPHINLQRGLGSSVIQTKKQTKLISTLTRKILATTGRVHRNSIG